MTEDELKHLDNLEGILDNLADISIDQQDEILNKLAVIPPNSLEIIVEEFWRCRMNTDRQNAIRDQRLT